MLVNNINLEEDIKKVLKFNEEELDKIPDEEVEKIKEKKGRTKTLISDVIFKAVFSNEHDILIKMIKDIFNIKEDINNPIVIVGYESVPVVFNSKTFKNDLLVKLSDNTCVVIEMNNKSKNGVLERNLIQLFRIHGQILKKGEDYENLDKYHILGLNFNNEFGKGKKEIDRYAFCNVETGEIASKIIKIVSIDVAKSTRLVYNKIRKKDADIPVEAIWASIMNEKDISKIRDILGGVLTMEEIDRLTKRIKDVNDDTKIMKEWMIEDNSRWYISETYYDGYNYGVEQGIEQGIKQGMAKGIESNKEEMIKNLLNQHVDYSVISKASGKTIEEIKIVEESMKEEK